MLVIENVLKMCRNNQFQKYKYFKKYKKTNFIETYVENLFLQRLKCVNI